ncbi:NAD-dependent epimerase/dehydratase family protein [Altericista sp. CCNU0014]|uniref:NAD-dependent epimerase/dehydratase family protein n=1 Tax=Altericista sp. CCNU0014 TaxID=3082949 RepID=UPI00384DC0DC
MNYLVNQKKCLILGGNGFIGQHLSRALLKKGFIVRILSKTKKEISLSDSLSQNPNIEWITGDFCDEKLIIEATKQVSYVFHLISTTLPSSSNLDPYFDIESNVGSTINLLKACVLNKVEKILFSSSGGTVYGIPKYLPINESHPQNPISSYGIQKLTIERYLYLYNHLYELKSSILRISNPFGIGQNINRGQGLITTFLIKVLRGENIEIWGDGSVIRDFIYIDDVIESFLAALEHPHKFDIYNIGSGVGTSILEVIKEIEIVLSVQARVKFKEPRSLDVPANILDITHSQNELCWSPKISLTEGIKMMAADLKNN